MIETSSLYKTLFNQGAIQEYQIEIEGVMYNQDVIYDKPEISENLFDTNTFTIGSFTVSSLKVKLWLANHQIPRNAEVKFYYRYVSDTEQSEWILKFVGNVFDRTRYTDEITTVTAYSKAANYDIFLDHFGSAISSYPANARTVANLCATHLGLTIDNIGDVYNGNIVEYPNEMTIIQVMQNIAKASGGNWSIVGENTLRLVVLGNAMSMPEYKAQSVEQSELISPISMVRVYWKDDSAFEAGDDSGSIIELSNPWATQANTNYLLSVLDGYEYVPVSGTKVYADPALQLGDVIRYPNGVIQTIAQVTWTFDGIATADISTPQDNELAYDNPYDILAQQEFKRKVTLGESYQGVTIGRENGIQMLQSPDGTEENATGRWYADLNKGMAMQWRDTPSDDWHDWLYFDKNEKIFKLSMYSTTAEVEGEFENVGREISELELSLDGIRLEVSQLGGYNIISNIIGRFGYLDWTFESSPVIAKSSPPYAIATNVNPFLAINSNGPISSPVETDTQSQSGFRFWHEGKMLSKIAPAEGGSNYSLYTRTKGTGDVTIKLREYTQALETNKNNFHKETTLGTTNTTTNWATFTSTTLLDENTQSVCLVFESNVNVYLQEYATLSDSSFNLGQPKAYGQSLTDVNNRVDSLNTRIDLYDDTIDLFTQKVSNVEGQVVNQQAQININSGEITSRVKKDEVISEINQTSETVKIQASRINLTGYVTVSGLANAGQTVINGSNITTGTINANNVSVINLNASSITAGTINANRIPNISADKITTGTLNANNVSITNLTASHITTGTLSVDRIPNLNASKITAGTISVDRIAANSITAGKISVSPVSQLSSALGTMSSGTVNNGSFSYGSFGGTLNSASGTLGGSSYSSISGGSYFSGRLQAYSGFLTGSASTMGTLLPNAAGSSNLGGSYNRWGRLFSTYSVDVSSDIRLKENFKTIDNEFDDFIYSLPIGTYNLKSDKDKKPQIGVNANFVDALFPKEVTQYLVEQDELGYYSAQYTNLVPMLVKVVQSQHHRLIDLEYEIKKMKGEA